MAFSAVPAPTPLACLRCKTLLPVTAEADGAGGANCPDCGTGYGYVFFPARRRVKPVARAVRSLDGDATCFFHVQNRAVSVCDGCGRYLCAVCELPGDTGNCLCPPCVSTQRKKAPQKVDEIVCYDQMALTLTFLPLLFWPLTLLTAPAAIGLSIYGWRKPRSLVRPGNGRFVFSMVFSTLELAGWGFFFLAIWANA